MKILLTERFQKDLSKRTQVERARFFETMLELSSLYGKDAIKEKLAGDPQQAQMLAQMQQMQQQIQQMAVQLDMADKQADIKKKEADTAKTVAETEQKRIENAIASAFPDVRPNVNI